MANRWYSLVGIFTLSVISTGLYAAVHGGYASNAQDRDSYLFNTFSALSGDNSRQRARVSDLSPAKPHMTLLLHEAKLHWDSLSDETRTLIRPWMLRPTTDGTSDYITLTAANTKTRDTAHFRIHYIDAADHPSDPNRATAAYVNSVAIELEVVWNREHSGLGYAAVPSDAGVPDNNGGNGLYDVYLGDIGGMGIYGYISGGTVYTDDPNRPHGSTSYMVLDNDFATAQYGYADPLDALKVTAAHEYFHSIQYGYDYLEQSAFMESSATWMEDKVYPTIHDNYQYIGEPYSDSNNNGQYDAGEPFTDHNANGHRDSGSADYPELPLDSFGAIGIEQYGRFLWVRFLDEVFGEDVVRSIWEHAGLEAGQTTFNAVGAALGYHSSNLASAYQLYAVWGYDKSRFSDGDNYPLVWVDELSTDGVAHFSSASTPSLVSMGNAGYPVQMHLSTVYQQINSPSGTYNFESIGGAAAWTILVDDGSGTLKESNIPLAAGSGSWLAPPGTTRAISVISNVSATENGMSWTLCSDAASSCGDTGGSSGGGGGGLDPLTLLLLGVMGVGSLWRYRRS